MWGTPLSKDSKQPKYDTVFHVEATTSQQQQSSSGTDKKRKRVTNQVEDEVLLFDDDFDVGMPTGRPANSSETIYIVALQETKSREVGMAAMNLKSPELRLSQFVDNTAYGNVCNMIRSYSPKEILVPSSMADSRLVTILKKEFPRSKIDLLAKKYFNESQGLAMIKQLAIREGLTMEIESPKRSLGVGAAACLIKYVEHVQGTKYASQTLKVTLQACDGHLLIDSASIANLELVQNIRTGGTNNTLYEVVNQTKTPMGARLLKANLLQPLNDINAINARLDCVSELLENEKLFFDIAGALKSLSQVDLDHLLTQFVHIVRAPTVRAAQSIISNIICLKNTLRLLPKLCSALGDNDSKSELFVAILANLDHDSVHKVADKIDEVIDEDITFSKNVVHMQTQQCFAVKTGINGLLDVARRQYTDTIEELHSLCNRYKDEYSLISLRLQYNNKRGYYLSMDAADSIKDITTENNRPLFIQKVKQGKKFACSTEEVSSLNTRIKDVVAEIYLMTERVVNELLDFIRKHLGAMYKVSEGIALVDMLFSFASVASSSDEYVRPEFSIDGPVAIKKGRHPILDKISPASFIPNDTYLNEVSNFHILTGPNMSGKSTYIRQVALLCIMAHIGSYVPASFASLRVSDKIFTRIGSDDDLESNSSSFMVEMKEIAYIIQNATNRSLIFIDELGRGTSNIEGSSIAWSICEYLLSLKAYTLFVTHYVHLTQLARIYPCVKNMHLMTRSAPNNQDLQFLYSVSEGSCNVERYGLKLARMYGLPAAVIDSAQDICDRIEKENNQKSNADAAGDRSNNNLRSYYQLAHRLLSLKNSSLDEDALKKYLKNMKQRWVIPTLPPPPPRPSSPASSTVPRFMQGRTTAPVSPTSSSNRAALIAPHPPQPPPAPLRPSTPAIASSTPKAATNPAVPQVALAPQASLAPPPPLATTTTTTSNNDKTHDDDAFMDRVILGLRNHGSSSRFGPLLSSNTKIDDTSNDTSTTKSSSSININNAFSAAATVPPSPPPPPSASLTTTAAATSQMLPPRRSLISSNGNGNGNKRIVAEYEEEFLKAPPLFLPTTTTTKGYGTTTALSSQATATTTTAAASLSQLSQPPIISVDDDDDDDFIDYMA